MLKLLLPLLRIRGRTRIPAKMLINRRLSGPGSEKDTRHIELSLAGSGLSYEVGESVAVYPTNCPELVEEMIAHSGRAGRNGDQP